MDSQSLFNPMYPMLKITLAKDSLAQVLVKQWLIFSSFPLSFLLSYFNFISPGGPGIEDSISKAVGRTCQDFPLLGIVRFYIPMVWKVGRRIPS